MLDFRLGQVTLFLESRFPLNERTTIKSNIIDYTAIDYTMLIGTVVSAQHCRKPLHPLSGVFDQHLQTLKWMADYVKSRFRTSAVSFRHGVAVLPKLVKVNG